MILLFVLPLGFFAWELRSHANSVPKRTWLLYAAWMAAALFLLVSAGLERKLPNLIDLLTAGMQ